MESEAFSCPHGHRFLSEHQHVNERRTWWVILLTVATMVLEIVSGLVFGSMALLADGWHMASHASALGITALAYFLARRHRDNPRFTFGTGKIGDLAGYSSALLLLLVALYMAYASVLRLVHPVAIRYREAMLVAVIGLVVNLVSALLLKEHHGQDEEGRHAHHDHNLRAAYLHVLADATTSILAIVALGFGRTLGWSFLDPVMGIVGAVLISHWSYGLIREAGAVLLDRTPDERLVHNILDVIGRCKGVRITDIHVWRLGPGHHSAILSLVDSDGNTPGFFKERLCRVKGLSHLTVEVNAPADDSRDE